jgi:hypothetical protein
MEGAVLAFLSIAVLVSLSAALPGAAMARDGGCGHGGGFPRLWGVIVAFALAAMPAAAMAQGNYRQLAGCEAVTNVPWGSIADSCMSGPTSGRFGPPAGGSGGPGMCISAEGHKNWPNYPGPVCGKRLPWQNR